MQSSLYVENPVVPGRKNRQGGRAPVDGGPFAWDRTEDGRLDNAKPDNTVDMAKVNDRITQHVLGLGSGKCFTCKDIKATVPHGLTQRRFKDCFTCTMRYLVESGAVVKSHYREYRVV